MTSEEIGTLIFDEIVNEENNKTILPNKTNHEKAKELIKEAFDHYLRFNGKSRIGCFWDKVIKTTSTGVKSPMIAMTNRGG